MPVYEYEHISEEPCEMGKIFEVQQSLADPELTECPDCGGKVKRIISLAAISTPKTNAELRDMGFTKLVRRDDGVYENVTQRGSDAKYMERGKPDTIPDVSKIISD